MSASRNSSTSRTSQFALGTRPNHRGLVPAPADLLLGQGLELLPRGERVRAAAPRAATAAGRAVTEDLGGAPALLLDPLEVLDAELVHLIRVERERRPREDLRRVHRISVGEGAEADRLGGLRQVVAERLQVALERGQEVLGDGGGDAPRVRPRRPARAARAPASPRRPSRGRVRPARSRARPRSSATRPRRPPPPPSRRPRPCRRRRRGDPRHVPVEPFRACPPAGARRARRSARPGPRGGS